MAPLADSFEQNDPSSYTDVERRNFPFRRNADQEITLLLEQLVQPLAFASDYQRAVAVIVHLVIGLVAALIQAKNPERVLLQDFECPGQVRYSHHRQVLHCAARRLDYRSG